MTIQALPMEKIGNLVSKVKTWNPSRDAAGQRIRYIDLGSVDNEAKMITGHQDILADEAPSRARQLVRAGDILVSTVRPNLNGVARVPEDLEGATVSTGFCVLRADSRRVVPEYLFHWVKTAEFVTDMEKRATGQSYPAVSDRIISESEIPLPPLDEQRRIAAILDQADALRRKRQEATRYLSDLSKSVFHSMFGIPDPDCWSWTVLPIRDAGRVQLGRQRAPKYQSGNHTRPYLRVANVYEDRLDLSDVLSMDFDDKDFPEYRLCYGDILLNEGQSTELVGRPAMWREEIPNCCFQNTLVRFQPDQRILLSEFALHVLLGYYRRGEFSKISSKTSNVAHLGAGRFGTMNFPVPPLVLQKEFVKKIHTIKRIQETNDAHANGAKELFASLQHRAFRGEL